MIGHASPEAAEGGAIGLVEEGDFIDIDIPARTINLRVTAEVLAHRRAAMEDLGAEAWLPTGRVRYVSQALQGAAQARPVGAPALDLSGWGLVGPPASR